MFRVIGIPVALLLCASTGPAQTFSEVSGLRGVDYLVEVTTSYGSGVLLADLDGDDDLDMVALGDLGGPGLFENVGNAFFVEHPSIPLASGAAGIASALSAADYDGDGDRDLLITVWEGPNSLFRNDGNFTFTDVSAVAGLDDDGIGMGSTWGDYDGDGWLDLYVSNRSGTTLSGGGQDFQPNRLYRNLGDGTFEERAVLETVDAGIAPTLQATFVDLDRDGDVELYLANDKGSYSNCMSWRNQLWDNQNGSLVEISSTSGTDVCVDSMTITLGDVNQDGLLDIYTTNTPEGNALMVQDPNGHFREVAGAYGVLVNQLSWGAVLIDYDLDQDQDLYVCNATSFNMMFRNEPTLPWPQVAFALGLADISVSYCVAQGDLDDDGDVDMILSSDDTRLKVLINNAATGNSLQVRPIGAWPNYDAIGATILVEAGGVTQVRAVAAGSAYKSQHELRQTYGLGGHTSADRIEIIWPGGEMRELFDYPAGSWLAIPDGLLGDFNRDGILNHRDARRLKGCLSAATFEPGCECFDFDGDADVDVLDAIEFGLRRGGATRVPAASGGGVIP